MKTLVRTRIPLACIVFRAIEGETDEGQKIRLYRDGYYGWYGFGGSVFMWNPNLRIGFGYVPTMMAWHDPYNLRGAKLQNEVAKCAKKQLDINQNSKAVE